MLEIRNLEKSFGNKQVLFGVDLTAQQGHILGLVGKNGAGKTTIFHRDVYKRQVEKLQKSLKNLLVLFLKQLSSMANRSVRLAVALTFVLNHLLALKKGSMWQPSMKPLMRQPA